MGSYVEVKRSMLAEFMASEARFHILPLQQGHT
jgi:hypothetical protein